MEDDQGGTKANQALLTVLLLAQSQQKVSEGKKPREQRETSPGKAPLRLGRGGVNNRLDKR
jgi:hypothetical protein